MGTGEVTHMDVIANARAVRGWIIIAENLHVGSLTGRRLENYRNQMRLGIMAFATEFRRARGVEIAEAHESHPVGLLVPVAGALKRELRLTIRVCGTRRVRFID